MARGSRRRLLGILVAICAVALAIVPAAIYGAMASAATAAASPQKADMAEFFKSYHPGDGLIGNSWWQAAVALSTLLTYQQTTGDKSYSRAIHTAFIANGSNHFEDHYMDDTAWWGLGWLQAYDMTHVRAYLTMAETDADYDHEYWDNHCGGGVWWSVAKTYKNAIPNELFLELTAWLHNTIKGDTKYLRWAKAEWSWFSHSGMINSSHLINDGLTAGCANNGRTTWTYNQGVILAGLAQLYQATKNTADLRAAETIAKAAISHLTVRGVLTEPCHGSECGNSTGGDVESFKGIFIRDLKVLAVIAKTTQFNSFFRKQASSIEAHDTNRYHQLGFFWSGPIRDLTSYSQASALDAIVASLKLP